MITQGFDGCKAKESQNIFFFEFEKQKFTKIGEPAKLFSVFRHCESKSENKVEVE
jgi:hypothetical protein